MGHTVICVFLERSGYALNFPGSAYDVVTGERLPEALQDLSDILAAEAYITVPVRYRGETVGRLYLTATGRYTFEARMSSFSCNCLNIRCRPLTTSGWSTGWPR